MQKRLLKNDKGQAVVEMAIVFPFLLLLILGMIEFGWILNGQITITAAAREGARSAVISQDIGEAKDVVTSVTQNSAANEEISHVTTTVTFSEETALVEITAEIRPIIGLFVSDDMTLRARAEMRLE